jgi:hypothetical protein
MEMSTRGGRPGLFHSIALCLSHHVITITLFHHPPVIPDLFFVSLYNDGCDYAVAICVYEPTALLLDVSVC